MQLPPLQFSIYPLICLERKHTAGYQGEWGPVWKKIASPTRCCSSCNLHLPKWRQKSCQRTQTARRVEIMTGPEKGPRWGNKQSASSVGARNEGLLGRIWALSKVKTHRPQDQPLEETPFGEIREGCRFTDCLGAPLFSFVFLLWVVWLAPQGIINSLQGE